MIAPQAGFLPQIHQQNYRNSPFIPQKVGVYQPNLPQINKYNQNSLQGYSVDHATSAQRNNNYGYRPQSNSQRQNYHQMPQNNYNQINYSPNRYPQNQQNQYGANNNSYQYNQDTQIYQNQPIFPQGNQANIDAFYNQNGLNPNIQIDNQAQFTQNLDGNQNIIQSQYYQQQPNQYQQQQYLQDRNFQQSNNQQNLQQQMHQFYGQPQQQNNIYSPNRKNYQDNQEQQNTSLQIGNYHGIQIRDRKAQSENQRNNQQLQKMKVNNTFSDSKKLNPIISEAKQDLANALKQQMEEKKKRQMEEKEKNRLQELNLLNYNLKNSPYSKNHINRQEKFIQQIKETSPNTLQQQPIILQRQSQNNDIFNNPALYSAPYISQPIVQDNFVPKESLVDIENQYNQNQQPQNQLSLLNQFTQANQLTTIPQVLVAGQVESNQNTLGININNQNINQQNTNEAFKTMSQLQKKSMILANNIVVDKQEQKEKDLKVQKNIEYQTFIQQQIEEVKARKKLERQKKIEEDLYYEQQFLKQLEQEKNKEVEEKYKKQQQYQNVDQQNKLVLNDNHNIRNQTPISQAAQAIDIAKQNLELAQNVKRQSSVQSTISQHDEQPKIFNKISQSRSQRSYTTNEDQNRVQKELERSQRIALEQQNPYLMMTPEQIVMMQKQQFPQYNIEQNQNIIEFQKGMSDMMNQLTENQQHIQQALQSIKIQSEDNTKNAQNYFKEIQKLIVQQQTQKNLSQEMSGIATHTSFNNNERLISRDLRSEQQQQQSTIQKLLQQSPNQVSEAVGHSQILLDQQQKKTHYKTRSSHSVDRESLLSGLARQDMASKNLLNSHINNTQPLQPYSSSHKDITDFINIDHMKKKQRQKITEKLGELNNDSVFLNYEPDSSRPLDKIQESSISDGLHITENGNEIFNIPTSNIKASNKKQQYEIHPVEEDGQSNYESRRSSSKLNQGDILINGSGDKNSLKRSIKRINKFNVEKVLEKNQSRLDNLNELENKSVYIQQLEFQKI